MTTTALNPDAYHIEMCGGAWCAYFTVEGCDRRRGDTIATSAADALASLMERFPIHHRATR